MIPFPVIAVNVNLSSPFTWIVIVGLIVGAIWAYNNHRQKLLNAIPAPIAAFLDAVGFNRLTSNGAVSLPPELSIIAALDNGVQTMLRLGMVEDAKMLQDLRYRLQVKAFGAQAVVFQQSSTSINTEELANAVASHLKSKGVA